MIRRGKIKKEERREKYMRRQKETRREKYMRRQKEIKIERYKEKEIDKEKNR